MFEISSVSVTNPVNKNMFEISRVSVTIEKGPFKTYIIQAYVGVSEKMILDYVGGTKGTCKRLWMMLGVRSISIFHYTGPEPGACIVENFEPDNPYHSIGNFVLPQKYVKNFVLA